MQRPTTTLVSFVRIASLWLLLIALAMDSTTCSAEAATTSLLVLRVDVQNLPRMAIQAGRSGHLSLRVASQITHHDLKTTLHERLVDVLDMAPTESASLDFDVEVYDSKADRFRPLTSVSQLGRRSRLNVVLHNRTLDQDDSNLLALPARMFAVDTRDGGFRINGHSVFVDQVENSGLGTGLTTWDGSVVLAKYLEHRFTKSGGFRGLRILEVGAGTGLVGLSAALIGGAEHVTLTDLAYTMPNLHHNIQRTMAQVPQSPTRVRAHVLDWCKPQRDFEDIDLILASDVVWVEELIAPLVDTLYHIASAATVATTILLSHQQRSVVSDAVLFRELDKHRFRLREVGTPELHPDFTSDKIHVWEITLN